MIFRIHPDIAAAQRAYFPRLNAGGVTPCVIHQKLPKKVSQQFMVEIRARLASMVEWAVAPEQIAVHAFPLTVPGRDYVFVGLVPALVPSSRH